MRYTVVDVRGTHGSGKSQAVFAVLQRYKGRPLMERDHPRRIYAYTVPKLNLYVVGPYTSVAGGCDRIMYQDQVCERIRVLARHGNVLCEGVIMSHLFKRYWALAQELAPTHDYKFLFLNTTLEQCKTNVLARRAASGNDKPFNPKNVIALHESTGYTRNALLRVGAHVTDVRYPHVVPAIMAALKGHY